VPETSLNTRVAIACQGGGSHTAFTAGALQRLMTQKPHDVDYVAFSGTSGGSICATIAWMACLQEDTASAAPVLEGFWRDNSATSLWDAYLNQSMMWYASLASVFPLPEVSPYNFPNWAHDSLRRLIEKHIPFDRLPEQIRSDSPKLSIGAVDVLSGEFKAFLSGVTNNEIKPEAILASTAIPTLFRSVNVDGRLYWDGLFSQNPPIQELTWAKPDEIWIIQINPKEQPREPRSLDEIRDRRNELAGNLSLNQEVRQIEFINQLLADEAIVNNRHYKRIELKFIKLERSLKASSKLNRSPRFIQDLMEHGRQQADIFLKSQRITERV
jgi:NTE family protein